MLNTMFDRGSLPAMEQILHFTALRHQALANNIANAETPKYKTLDISEKDFRSALAEAYEGQRRSPVGVFEFLGRCDVMPGASGGLDARLLEAPPDETGILRHIENNVDIDIEMGKMVKNAGLHNLMASLLNHQFNMLREAIAERITS